MQHWMRCDSLSSVALRATDSAAAADDNAGSGSRRLLYFMDPEAEPFDVIPPEEAVHLASSSPYPRYNR